MRRKKRSESSVEAYDESVRKASRESDINVIYQKLFVHELFQWKLIMNRIE